MRIFCYAVSGFLAALTGVLLASRLGQGTPTVGSAYELWAAAVIGGTSLMGGEGTVAGAILGAAIVGVILIRDLSVAKQQTVKIAKALGIRAQIIIMDEPTSALGEEEVEALFGIVQNLKAQGRASPTSGIPRAGTPSSLSEKPGLCSLRDNPEL